MPFDAVLLVDFLISLTIIDGLELGLSRELINRCSIGIECTAHGNKKRGRREFKLKCEHPLVKLRFCNGHTKSRGARDSSLSSWVQVGDHASEWDGTCRGYSRRRGWRRRRDCCRGRSARRSRRAAELTPARRWRGLSASCPSGSWCSGGRSCRTARVPAEKLPYVFCWFRIK